MTVPMPDHSSLNILQDALAAADRAQQKSLPQSLAAPADDGLPSPELEAALLAWASAQGDTAAAQQAVIEAFRVARMYVAAVAPQRDQIGTIALRREDGMTAIPVFTSIERLIAWKPEARPLPHIGSIVASMARDDGHQVAVIDIDGPITATLPLEAILN